MIIAAYLQLQRLEMFLLYQQPAPGILSRNAQMVDLHFGPSGWAPKHAVMANILLLSAEQRDIT